MKGKTRVLGALGLLLVGAGITAGWGAVLA
jgi:hypothetical protein